MKTRSRVRRVDSLPSHAAPEDVEVTLLFCDVVRSTELARRLGDRCAYRVIEGFHVLVVRAAARLDGQELELRGDGVLLAFGSPQHAVDCAVEIQRRLLHVPPARRVSVRIGLHTGAVLRVSHGYFGANVIYSSRVAEEAAPGEILASAALVQRLAAADLLVDAGRWVSLKGIPEPSLVFSLPWRPGRAGVIEPGCPSAAHQLLARASRESNGSSDEPSCLLDGRGTL